MTAAIDSEGPIQRLEWWILFSGDRLIITGGVMVAVFVLAMALAWLDIIALGTSSYMSLVFSGIIAGLLTLITVTLTINQLILSRLFGTPEELDSNLEGSRQFRESIEDLADRHSAPTEPADFLSLIGETLYDRATNFHTGLAEATQDRHDESSSLSDIVSEADALRNIDADEARGIDVLGILLGSKHARNMAAVDRIQGAYEDRLSKDTQSDLDDVTDLLKGLAIARQHYKTLLLQQTLAQLSRYVTYFGFCGIIIALFVPLMYRTSASPMVGPQYLPWVACAGFAISIAPLVVFLAYILRIAVVSQYTLSVSPFVPPAGKAREE